MVEIPNVRGVVIIPLRGQSDRPQYAGQTVCSTAARRLVGGWVRTLGSRADRSQLQQVVGGTQQGPFALHVGEPPQQQLAEAARVFDEPEDRLYGLLAQPIPAPPPAAPQLTPHRGGVRAPGRRAIPAGVCLPMRLPAGGDVGVEVAPVRLAQIRLRTVAGIRRDLRGLAPRMGLDLDQHRSRRTAAAPTSSPGGTAGSPAPPGTRR